MATSEFELVIQDEKIHKILPLGPLETSEVQQQSRASFQNRSKLKFSPTSEIANLWQDYHCLEILLLA